MIVALAAVLLALTSACGDSSSANAGTAPKRSVAAFTKCLRQHGVQGFGAPGNGQGVGGGAPPSGGRFQGQAPPGDAPAISSKLRKALSACAAYAPRHGQGAPPAGVPNGGP